MRRVRPLKPGYARTPVGTIGPRLMALMTILADGKEHRLDDLAKELTNFSSRRAISVYISKLRSIGLTITTETIYRLERVGTRKKGSLRR